MERRIRPVSYAEALEAKEFKEKKTEKSKEEKIDFNKTSINSIKIDELPSAGKVYPEGSEIYFTPLSFGEMKFLGGSSLKDIESIDFFLSKIQSTFDVEDLTYYDFYFITIMIKLATFGETEYKMSFECNSCGHLNKIPFSTSDLEFDDIKVDLPIIIDLKQPYISETGVQYEKIEFKPISIGRYKNMIKADSEDDYDLHIANCISNEIDEKGRLEIIKSYLNGVDANLLEVIDVSLYHGVKDLKMKCTNKIKRKDEDGNEITEEVCGREYDIPFQHITQFISTSDKCKESLGKRIHFGL